MLSYICLYISFSLFLFSSFLITRLSKVIISAEAVFRWKADRSRDSGAELVEQVFGNFLPLVSAADLSPRTAAQTGLLL